jgi:hypothetical protein
MIADSSTPLRTGLKGYAAMKDSGVPWLEEVPGATLQDVRADLVRLEEDNAGVPENGINGER